MKDGMETRTLRRAAELMQGDEDRRWLPVGRWLWRAAEFWGHPDIASTGRPADYDIALAVARAYLGETA